MDCKSNFQAKLMTTEDWGWLNETNRCSNVVVETIFHGIPYCASNLLNKYYYGCCRVGYTSFALALQHSTERETVLILSRHMNCHSGGPQVSSLWAELSWLWWWGLRSEGEKTGHLSCTICVICSLAKNLLALQLRESRNSKLVETIDHVYILV